MPSYKILLIKAHPTEMKFLMGYATKISGKLLVDQPDGVGLVKEVNVNGQTIQYPLGYPADEDAAPPVDVDAVPGYVAVQTEDNLESKKAGIVDLYAWALTLDEADYNSIALGPNENDETVAILQKV